MPTAHILVAEDDTHIRDGLVDTLESEGYTVDAAADGDAAVAAFDPARHHLVMLDIMMPRRNGYDVCRELRRRDATVPILFLTAKGQEIDKVLGLELGADDYITKPFGLRELLARVAAVLRRSRLGASPSRNADDSGDTSTSAVAEPNASASGNADEDGRDFRFGLASIDRRAYRGVLQGHTFELSARELELLDVFRQHPGEVLSREDLLRMVWGQHYFGTTRTLDQHIAMLRKKIEPDPPRPVIITTVHGVGYRYEGER